MTEPTTLEEYQEACKENLTSTGEGPDKVTWFPCPGCTVAGWKGFPATAGLDDEVMREPSECLACSRTFKLEIKRTERGVEACVVHLGGPPMPPYLPETINFL